MTNKIKKYWDERAEQSSSEQGKTTNDIYLRELEANTIIETLKNFGLDKNSLVMDVGCGDGRTTLKFAQSFPEYQFLGIDYSDNMIRIAHDLLQLDPNLSQRVKFIVGDATKLEDIGDQSLVDVIITDRCLINLESASIQYDAIGQIAQKLKPSGYYIAIENFVEGQEAMNEMRRAMELPEIPVRWHNLYFDEDEFRNNVLKWFENIKIINFSSSYYFATRVIYSKLCQLNSEEPDYKHQIHQLGVKLPWFGEFSPVKMVILQKMK
jgi:Methylase involved in ubiquinone/menaquinone biosynthesis